MQNNFIYLSVAPNLSFFALPRALPPFVKVLLVVSLCIVEDAGPLELGPAVVPERVEHLPTHLTLVLGVVVDAVSVLPYQAA